MAGAVSFILIVCLRLVLAFDVLDLGTAISQPRLSKIQHRTANEVGRQLVDDAIVNGDPENRGLPV
jgi:hypothetical protein